MYSEEDIESAIAAGVFSKETAEAFRAHVAGQHNLPAIDEEHFRLVTGFNDIFVVIACVLLLISVAWLGGELAVPASGLATASTAWGLAEFFTRRRRMALPSIVLLLAFVGGLFMAFLKVGVSRENIILASLMAGVGAGLHWWRFKVPITVAAGAAAVVSLLLGLILAAFPSAKDWLLPITWLGGFAVFALAMMFDGSDPNRQTRRSDVAFWLHLLAAPMLVHPVFALFSTGNTPTGLNQGLVVVGLYGFIALVSLCIDRRALMVSALAYVLYTFSSLLKEFGVVSLSFALTALVIGSALLLLSAFWHPCRGWVLILLPESLRQRLPPHECQR